MGVHAAPCPHMLPWAAYIHQGVAGQPLQWCMLIGPGQMGSAHAFDYLHAHPPTTVQVVVHKQHNKTTLQIAHIISQRNHRIIPPNTRPNTRLPLITCHTNAINKPIPTAPSPSQSVAPLDHCGYTTLEKASETKATLVATQQTRMMWTISHAG